LYSKYGHADGMSFSIKYFQNVHDTVRDLLSKAAVEKNFKEGMRSDKDGFQDITWCRRKVVPDWTTMRKGRYIYNTFKCNVMQSKHAKHTRRLKLLHPWFFVFCFLFFVLDSDFFSPCTFVIFSFQSLMIFLMPVCAFCCYSSYWTCKQA
jgi:hypothetical protein